MCFNLLIACVYIIAQQGIQLVNMVTFLPEHCMYIIQELQGNTKIKTLCYLLKSHVGELMLFDLVVDEMPPVDKLFSYYFLWFADINQ